MVDAEPQAGPNLVRHGSARLVLETTRTFTGGAAVLPPSNTASSDGEATEQTPLQQDPAARRAAAAASVGERLLEETGNFVSRNILWISLLVVLCLCVVMAMFVLLIPAILATLYHSDKPCDQPFQYYVVVTLAWSQVPSLLTPAISDILRSSGVHSPSVRALTSYMLATFPGWLILAWGVYMVETTKTCPKDNPELYNPIRRFIYSQIIVAALLISAFIFTVFLLRRILLIVNRLDERPGCEDAVRNLPKVETDSSELFDPEDGRVMDCTICLEPLDCEISAVVRAPCTHLFHEECLASWCKNHVDCPLCREQVGEPEIDSKMEEV
eukprot:TRINITY_DN49026_c0_g1_i1.p1 TRINITY_DN49026_c0_g1~~TRINITY_DN49026_c0_g1_i1.p1  ORF type:complete len:327 (-),score=65.62 TRINITY_DN49026_c0_g1_i1:44-1024(-)